ncbi:MAG: hypothetical protein AAF680_07830 [Pseudomonadota bacterium]
MNEQDRFDIAFAGECLDGFEPASVRVAIGRLFKADDATLERLFSGKRQKIKKNCDRETAAKYQRAIRDAGGKAIITRAQAPILEVSQDQEPAQERKRSQGVASETADPVAVDTKGTGEKAAPSAEVEQAVGADPDLSFPDPVAENRAAPLSLAPAGSDVLQEHERQVSTAVHVTTDHLELAQVGEDLGPSTTVNTEAVAVPDFELLAAGENLTDSVESPTELRSATSALELCPPEHDLSDCAPTKEEAPSFELSGIALADAGSDLLEASERQPSSASAPDTSHLSIADTLSSQD